MKPLAKAQLPTESGSFEVRAYDSGFHDFPHLVLLSKAKSRQEKRRWFGFTRVLDRRRGGLVEVRLRPAIGCLT